MNKILKGYLTLICLLTFIMCLPSYAANQEKHEISSEQIQSRIIYLVTNNDTAELVELSEYLLNEILPASSDSVYISDLYYYAGVCRLLSGSYKQALTSLQNSVGIRERLQIYDEIYAKGISNLGVVNNYMGKYGKMIELMLHYIEIAKKLYRPDSPEVISAYSMIIGASLENKDFDKFREYTFITLEMLNSTKGIMPDEELSDLYINIGAGYGLLYDYAKARIYFEEAESILNRKVRTHDDRYINLINNLAIIYGKLGFQEKEKEYFELGITMAEESNSYMAFNIINSFSIELGEEGNKERGEELLSKMVKKAGLVYGTDSRFYYSVVCNYAEYLRYFMNDYTGSLKYYNISLEYFKSHPDDITMKDKVMTGYALTLSASGEYMKALMTIREILFSDTSSIEIPDLYENPDIRELKADDRNLKIFRAKYEILWQLFEETDDFEVLVSAASTSEIIVYLIDRIRINISEEESRLILGDNYRESYLNSIRDFELCYRRTGDHNYLEKVFEYAEKSKVAGLLAATRELNAVNFHIPVELAELERSLQRELAYYNSRIADENEKQHPDENLLSEWNRNLLTVTGERDSLIMTYERDYPEYYNLKYDVAIPEMADIPDIAGHRVNYINYIISDTLMYIMLVNRKNQNVVKVKIDSLFFNNILKFREHLSNPGISKNAGADFKSYQETAVYLYEKLIQPVLEYFISSYLLISPDNILSYIPFETIISSKYTGEEILYRKLPYLMNDYSISYAYSAYFSKEAGRSSNGKKGNLVAFAPVYPDLINIDSLIMRREAGSPILNDLPFARQEAEYVASLTGGDLYLNEDASESAFKSEAGNYGIIHLAMHTYLNDRNPMNSAMVFTQNEDIPEDGLLHTYEVYGIQLKARMVVLSSCNTGSGTLFSGEGILSLARGFMYSGGQCVVMSMWEIEDKSGTEIVKLFYENLLKGKSKSRALKSARSEYLKDASQLKSHPYFWASLVIYGNDSAVFPSHHFLIGSVFIFLIFLVILHYRVWKHKYS